MRRKRVLAWTGAVLVMVLVAIQFVPVQRTNPPVTAEVVAPAPVATILRSACYDCHSNETRWPWYSHVAPLSWWVVEHVRDGRKDLNFSRWPVFDLDAQAEILRDITDQIEKGEMPLKSYQLGHPEARLDVEQKAILLDWARAGG